MMRRVPRLRAPGVATVIVFETGSELSARRQVAIPAAIVPTATPLPQYALAISIEQPSGDKVAVNVAIPPEITLAQTELLVDGQSLAVATAPPFDQFVLDVNQLGSGNHTIRVEALDTNGVSASAEVELMLTLPPTPPPAPTLPPPTPAPTPVVESAAPSSLLLLPLVLICLGLLLLLALMGFISYLLLARSKSSVPPLEPTQPVPPRYMPAVSPPAFTPVDDEDAADKTLLQGPTMVPGSARLVVVMGQELVNQPEFLLRQPETKIGRNTGKEAGNDVVIKDLEVSRSHAVIRQHHRQYFVQDLNSTVGTEVNGHKLQPGQETALEHLDEIQLGPRVRFRFETTAEAADDEGKTIIDLNVDELRAKYGNADPFRTQYD